MAITPAGAKLTQEHRLAQRAGARDLVARLIEWWRKLAKVPLTDQDTWRLYLDTALPVIEQAHARSQYTAAQYLDLFRGVEAPMAPPLPLLGNGDTVLHPVRFDTHRAAATLIAAGPKKLVQAERARSFLSIGDAGLALLDAEPETVARQRVFGDVAGAGVRLALDGGRDQIRAIVDLDAVVIGYQRVTKPGCCSFCAVLAALGVWYKSTKSFAFSDAKYVGLGPAKVHNHCQCTLEPVYGHESELPEASQGFRDLWEKAQREKAPDEDPLHAFRREYESVHGSYKQNNPKPADRTPAIRTEDSTPAAPETAVGPDNPPPNEPPIRGAAAAADDEPPNRPIIPSRVIELTRGRRPDSSVVTPPTVEALEAGKLIAPDNEPHMYFLEKEGVAAAWLESAGVSGIRSVKRREGDRLTTPDSVFDSRSARRALEIKTLDAPTFNAVRQNLRKARRQARMVAIDGRVVGLTAEVAEKALRNVVQSWGFDFDQIVIRLGDGTAIAWMA